MSVSSLSRSGRRSLLAAAALVCGASTAIAQPLASAATPSVYLQAAHASHGEDAWTLGATLPWQDWRYPLWGGQVSGYWDFYLSQWAADGQDGRFHTTVLGVTPSFRFTPNDGHSRWFLDAGVGATLASRRFVTLDKEFSTRFNFATHLGVGVALGAQRQHELQVRVQHLSNGGIKKPNPGVNFLQLRYALHF